MKLIIFIFILFIYSCNEDQILIEIKPPFDETPKGTLHIDNKVFKIAFNKELYINIKQDARYKLYFESEDSDVYGYISSALLNNKEKTTLTLNHNKRFRKLNHLIPTLDNFNCYLYDNYNFYILKNDKIETFSLINHSIKEIKINNIDTFNCMNIKGEFLVNKKEILFIKKNKIKKIITNKEFKNVFLLKNKNNYIIADIDDNTITFLMLDLDKNVEITPFTTTIFGFENKNVNLLFQNNKIILWQNGKLYHLVNNELILYHDFKKEGKLFKIENELFLFSKKKVFKIENKSINNLNLNILIDNYNIIELNKSLLIVPNHINNRSEYYVFNKINLKGFKVKNSMINIKNFDSLQIDKYQYLFFNKNSFEDITHSNFFLFSDF